MDGVLEKMGFVFWVGGVGCIWREGLGKFLGWVKGLWMMGFLVLVRGGLGFVLGFE